MDCGTNNDSENWRALLQTRDPAGSLNFCVQSCVWHDGPFDLSGPIMLRLVNEVSVFTGFAKREEKKQFIQVGLLKQLCFLHLANYNVRSELNGPFLEGLW